MFSAVNFRALLDFFQGLLALLGGLGPKRDYEYPTDGVASKDFWNALSAFEKKQKADKEKATRTKDWTSAESLAARMERTKQIIQSIDRPNILSLLNSESAVRLLSEKASFIRMWGNVNAHRMVEQSTVLEDMVHQCAENLDQYQVSGLLDMIKALRAEPEETAEEDAVSDSSDN